MGMRPHFGIAANRRGVPLAEVQGLATLLVPTTHRERGPQRAGCQFPLRTASTTSRIESITSWGCSLWISWPLFVLVMSFAFGTSCRAQWMGSTGQRL